MNVDTRTQPPSGPGFFGSDLRDPSVLGWALLVRARTGSAPLSEVYDRDAALLERVPKWRDNGLMSNDPATHHSNVTDPRTRR